MTKMLSQLNTYPKIPTRISSRIRFLLSAYRRRARRDESAMEVSARLVFAARVSNEAALRHSRVTLHTKYRSFRSLHRHED